MSVYLVSYDLRKVRNYESLYRLLEDYLGSVRLLESVWSVQSHESASAIYQRLKAVLDRDDRLLVQEIGQDGVIRNPYQTETQSAGRSHGKTYTRVVPNDQFCVFGSDTQIDTKVLCGKLRALI